MVLGYDGRCFLLPLVGSETDVLLAAAEHARAAADVPPGWIALLLPATSDPTTVREVTDRGFALVLAVDDPTRDRFALAQGDDFAQPVEAHDPALCAVRVRWHPDDAPEAKKAQALGLTRLAAWLHETDRSLLIELTTDPNETDLAAVGGDRARDARERGPGRTGEAIGEIRDLGVDADLWVLDAPAARADLEMLAGVLRGAGRDRVAGLVRITADDAADELVRTSATLDAYRGVAFDPSLWSRDLDALAAGERSREDVARTIGDRLAATIDLYTAAQPA